MIMRSVLVMAMYFQRPCNNFMEARLKGSSMVITSA
jgi:hypothetical protein